MPKRHVLGRGLNALIPDVEPSDLKPQPFFYCDIDSIRPNPYQPRRRVSDQELKGLSSSIKEKGIIQPLVVRPVTTGYELIVGERRWRAARLGRLRAAAAGLRAAAAGRGTSAQPVGHARRRRRAVARRRRTARDRDRDPEEVGHGRRRDCRQRHPLRRHRRVDPRRVPRAVPPEPACPEGQDRLKRAQASFHSTESPACETAAT